jgi:hypothetical protein
MPACMDIALRRNEAFSRTIFIADDTGAPIDLTGATLAMQVRDKVAQALIATADIEITDGANGEITITLDASAGSALNSYGNPIQAAQLPYDLRMVDTDGTPVDLIAGLITLSRGETTS